MRAEPVEAGLLALQAGITSTMICAFVVSLVLYRARWCYVVGLLVAVHVGIFVNLLARASVVGIAP